MPNARITLLSQKLKNLDAALFTEVPVDARKLPARFQIAFFLGFAVLFTGLGFLIPAFGLSPYDWEHFFSQGIIPGYYPPWTIYVKYLSLPAFTGISLAAISLAIIRRSVHLVSGICAAFTLQVFWVIYLGQLDALVLLGLLALPWFTPLAILKPQISIFAFAARKTYLAGLVITLVISFMVWGFWPAQVIQAQSVQAGGLFFKTNDIALGYYGLLISLATFWFSRGDIDMLMLCGAFSTPYLHSYHLLPVTPAVARLPPRKAAVAALLSWLPLLANWLGTIGWWLGWLFVGWLWISLAVARYQRKHPTNKINTGINP